MGIDYAGLEEAEMQNIINAYSGNNQSTASSSSSTKSATAYSASGGLSGCAVYVGGFMFSVLLGLAAGGLGTEAGPKLANSEASAAAGNAVVGVSLFTIVAWAIASGIEAYLSKDSENGCLGSALIIYPINAAAMVIGTVIGSGIF